MCLTLQIQKTKKVQNGVVRAAILDRSYPPLLRVEEVITIPIRSTGPRAATLSSVLEEAWRMTLLEEVMGSTLLFAGVMELEKAEPSHACRFLHKKRCVESMPYIAVWEGFETRKEFTGEDLRPSSLGEEAAPHPGSWPHATSAFDARTCLLQREGEGEGEKTKKVCCMLQEGEERKKGERRNATARRNDGASGRLLLAA
jgi:hypothetical protein